MRHSWDDDETRAPIARGNPAEAPGSADDPRFDRWLSRRLHEAYDSVLREDVPADLERLVRQFAEQTGDHQPDPSGMAAAAAAPVRRNGFGHGKASADLSLSEALRSRHVGFGWHGTIQMLRG